MGKEKLRITARKLLMFSCESCKMESKILPRSHSSGGPGFVRAWEAWLPKRGPPPKPRDPPQTQDRVLSEGLGASLSKASQTDARCQPLRAPGVPGLEPGLVLAVPCGPVSLGSRRAEPEKKRPRLRNWTLRRTRLPASPRGHVPERVPVTRLRARARRFLVTLQC